ncbi:MAG TPA: DUF423 domain-containing protein [Candidatus Polarisedimenticolaceae bacterium]|nr:DUF423 domain-containing protein [Candidatus Polarisedimenticolaceae bacterium]
MGWLATGAIVAGSAVALGAFGAHGLKTRVAAELLAVFETGVRYQMYHGLGLLAVGLAAARWGGAAIQLAGWLFLAGVALFSGTLYLMTWTGARWLGAVTPIGGLLLIAGWIVLAVGALRAGG